MDYSIPFMEPEHIKNRKNMNLHQITEYNTIDL